MKYLEKLARIFQTNRTRVYVVGSFVRHIVANDACLDVDLCGEKTPSEVAKMLDGTEFECLDINNNLLCTKISVKGRADIQFDYTTFRKDKYEKNGGHHPYKIERAKNIREDYIRRDFTVNAIYFDPLTKEYFDYCGGLIDLKHRLLKTITDPDICFACDALRIVRLIRFAVDGPYNIEYNTFQAAKRQAEKIANITNNKFNKELAKIKNKELGIKLLKEIFPWKEF